MADVPAMIGALDNGILRRLIDLRGRATPPEVAHACPPSDPCAGSDAAHAWADIGFIAAATSPAPSWSSLRYVRHVSLPCFGTFSKIAGPQGREFEPLS